MRHQNTQVYYQANKIERPSKQSTILIATLLIISSSILLSSCTVWVRSPGGYGHGQHDNGRHRGDRH